MRKVPGRGPDRLAAERGFAFPRAHKLWPACAGKKGRGSGQSASHNAVLCRDCLESVQLLRPRIIRQKTAHAMSRHARLNAFGPQGSLRRVRPWSVRKRLLTRPAQLQLSELSWRK